MPRICTVCVHPEHERIDQELLAGASLRNIAERFGTSVTALHRHKGDHLPATLAQARDAQDVAHGTTLLEGVRTLQSRSLQILERAEQAGQLVVALGAIRETRGCIELMAKLVGELDERPQVNILVAPEWIEVRAVLTRALAPYPEARGAVAAALLEVEGS